MASNTSNSPPQALLFSQTRFMTLILTEFFWGVMIDPLCENFALDRTHRTSSPHQVGAPPPSAAAASSNLQTSVGCFIACAPIAASAKGLHELPARRINGACHPEGQRMVSDPFGWLL
jgi:hypothetical protein